MVQLLRSSPDFNYRLWAVGLSCLLMLAGYSLQAQDPIFSQYYAIPMHINPGFSGISQAPRFELMYRNQWPLIESSSGGYVTYSATYDQFFKKANSGIGIQLLADDAGGGLLKTTKAAFTYGYQVRLDRKSYLRGGIELGYVHSRFGWDKFVFGDQLHPEFGPFSPGGTPIPTTEVRPDKVQVGYMDLGTGLLFINPGFTFGIAAKHINSPSNDILKINHNSFGGIPVRWVLHGNAQIPLGRSGRKSTILAPALLLAKQSAFFQMNIGAQLQFSSVYTGLWYRHVRKNPDALIAVFGIRKGIWKIGYSFDFTLSELGIGQGGSHEISIGINLDEIYKVKGDVSDCFEAFR